VHKIHVMIKFVLLMER